MVNTLSRNPLDTVVQKALTTPKIASSDSVLQLVAADIMQRDPREPNNQAKGYLEFVNDYRIYHPIIRVIH